MIKDVVEKNVHAYAPQNEDPNNWNLEGLVKFVHANLLPEGTLRLEDLTGKEPEQIIELILQRITEEYNEREETIGPEKMREFEKVIVLRTVDSKWIDHIDAMDQLRQGIHLRAYGQSNPLQAYQTEGFAMFENMVESIKDDVAKYIMKSQIVDNLKREEVAKGQAVRPSSDGDQKPKRKPIRVTRKIGRNDPCYCGSGKKYKNCHGRFES